VARRQYGRSRRGRSATHRRAAAGSPGQCGIQSWVGAFLQGLAQSGWRNIRIETRWTKFDAEETRKYAAELVALAPDVILASGAWTVSALQRASRSCS
jgi:putative ABC transport system substrate-binding protein